MMTRELSLLYNSNPIIAAHQRTVIVVILINQFRQIMNNTTFIKFYFIVKFPIFLFPKRDISTEFFVISVQSIIRLSHGYAEIF